MERAATKMSGYSYMTLSRIFNLRWCSREIEIDAYFGIEPVCVLTSMSCVSLNVTKYIGELIK